MVKRGRGRPSNTASDNIVQEMANSSDEKLPYSDDLPEFFKIYLRAMSSETMRIPPQYIEKFGGNIPTICTLELPSGVSWQVESNRVNDHWFFQKGWPEFVQENSLEEGDFLTFSYAGSSTFYVKIYLPNGCLKRADDTSGTGGEPTHQNLQDNQVSQPESPRIKRSISRNLRPKRSSSLARTSVGQNNPCFSLRVSRSYARKGSLPVPIDFWRMYMRENKKGLGTVTLRIRDNAWNVGFSTGRGTRIQFTKGCPQFVRDNDLKSGNSCTFELIDMNNLVFKVTVHR